jgi:hypothetical protein
LEIASMLKTYVWSGVLLLAAFGGPIGLFHFSDFWSDLKSGKVNLFAKSDKPDSTKTVLAANASEPKPPNVISGPTNLAVENAPIYPVGDVFRFDLAPAEVLRRWPRVSTELPALNMHGYRVPLVSGTDPTGLAGALTYYFNPAQQVQRITFSGTSGDPRAIILLLTSRYHYARRPNNDPSRLVYESANGSGKLHGQVVIRSVPVVRASDPYKKYEIELSMNRPEE